MKVTRNASLTLTSTTLGAVIAVIAAVTLSSAQATAPQQMVDQYAGMCVKSVTMPAPYGESDLNGNPKLQDYCKCFGAQFAERAMTAAQDVKATPTADAVVKQELAMRNSCRQKFGLPLSK